MRMPRIIKIKLTYTKETLTLSPFGLSYAQAKKINDWSGRLMQWHVNYQAKLKEKREKRK